MKKANEFPANSDASEQIAYIAAQIADADLSGEFVKPAGRTGYQVNVATDGQGRLLAAGFHVLS